MPLNNLKLIEEFPDKFGQQEPRELLQNPLLQKDIWLVKEDLGLSIPAHMSLRTINFTPITNDWFKLCLKLYTLLRTKSGFTAATVHRGVMNLSRFFNFLTQQSVNDFDQIENLIFEAYEYHLVKELKLRPRTVEGHLSNLAIFLDTCRLEGWFEVNTYWFKGKRHHYNRLPKNDEIEYIPEEVWNQLDQNLKYLPEPIQRMVILLRCTGVRVGELCNLPLDCLRKRGDQWRIRFTTEKYDVEDELPIVMPDLVAVIKEQQSYIKQQFGDSYDKLFCGNRTGNQYRKKSTDDAELKQLVFSPKPEVMSCLAFNNLLNRLAQVCQIRTKDGQLWHFRSHQFRRTVATVMTNAGVRDLIIQKYLRHRSTRMLSKLELIPVKEVMLSSTNPLTKGIRHLIKSENIRDENGKLAKFSNKLIRPTRLTKLFEQGHDLAVVSAWAGHKNPDITATYYTYVSCQQIEKEAGHIQKVLFNAEGQQLSYESLPKSFWKNPRAHQLELSGDHINTPIYGYCGLPLEQRCDKFRACYTCRCFVAVPEKLSQYIKTRDELRAKETRARDSGADVLVEQYQRQAEQLDKIIASLEGVA